MIHQCTKSFDENDSTEQTDLGKNSKKVEAKSLPICQQYFQPTAIYQILSW